MTYHCKAAVVIVAGQVLYIRAFRSRYDGGVYRDIKYNPIEFADKQHLEIYLDTRQVIDQKVIDRELCSHHKYYHNWRPSDYVTYNYGKCLVRYRKGLPRDTNYLKQSRLEARGRIRPRPRQKPSMYG